MHGLCLPFKWHPIRQLSPADKEREEMQIVKRGGKNKERRGYMQHHFCSVDAAAAGQIFF